MYSLVFFWLGADSCCTLEEAQVYLYIYIYTHIHIKEASKVEPGQDGYLATNCL